MLREAITSIATAISERTSFVMISMGSGSGFDAQYLFATDVLGTTPAMCLGTQDSTTLDR